MDKILKPYTIIPSDLYVQRDADIQVRNIINDMGRPGYVLVSRQMGKTNLLLNAKRNFESDNNIFLYIDLSNAFDDARSCFENIIDTAIDTYPEKFDNISKDIYTRRAELINTPPHKQHTNELRLLLQALNGGKMVIMLDEIDALTKTNYSDQIFSQIRSIYFASRVNFKEFHNLTYLLSGVVEPNEIIKDPKISPFNIGEKIYLNDFSKIEFNNFIDTSKLSLTQELKDRIFFWTNGNPRTTWDICSEIENLYNSGIDASTIDKIVQDLYLTSFDKPPIDNIRELVVKDSEIRNSIIEIEYNKTSEISDRLKSKLYLAGIINYSEKDIHIKNQIIKKSLSLEWIKSIEEEEKGLVRLAIELSDKHNYSESLKTFEKYLENNSFTNDEASISYYYMGYASYRLNSYDNAINYFNKANFDIHDESRLYYRNINLLGLSYYYTGNIDESLTCFKKVIDSGRNDELFVRSLLNYGSISLKSDGNKYRKEAEVIFNDIINERAFAKEKVSPDLIEELKSISYYNLAQIYSDSGNKELAKNHFELAYKLSLPKIKPTILLSLLNITDLNSDRIIIIDNILDIIIDNDLKPVEDDPERPIEFNFDDLRKIISKAYTTENKDTIKKASSLLFFLNDKALDVQLYELSIFSINNNDESSSKAILHYLIKHVDLQEEIHYKTLKLLSYFFEDKDKEFSKLYIQKFSIKRIESINSIDFVIFANLIFSLSNDGNSKEALEYIRIITKFKNEVQDDVFINYLVIHHLEINIYIGQNDKYNSLKTASILSDLLSNKKIKSSRSNLLGDTGLNTIRKNVEYALQYFNRKNVDVRKLNRNDIVKVRYINGTTTIVKYKKVEQQIKNGECIIIND